jgi:hypothetical protein
MPNPFHLAEIPVDGPFCDREIELTELRSYAEARANVVVYSPRRYGKTSLVKRVQKSLHDQGAVTVYADFFGVAGVEDVAARLAEATYFVTYRRESLWQAALKAIRSFRPVIKPDPESGMALSVEPASTARTGLPLLRETMECLGEFIRSTGRLVHVALDEFQEIVNLTDALQIEAVVRTHVQQQQASYFFIGSRRSVLLRIFCDRQRPFFQSAINYELGPLPEEDLIAFLRRQFTENKKPCTAVAASKLISLVHSHPYYAQKLAFFVYETPGAVKEDSIDVGFERMLLSEKPVFEAVLQGLPPRQRLLLRALAKEPTRNPMGSAFMVRHRTGSGAGVHHSLQKLKDMDLIEKDEKTGMWRIVDPILAVWLRRQDEVRL